MQKFILFLGIVVGFKVDAFEGVLTDWDHEISRVTFEGQAQLGFDVYSRPSSKEGDTAFILREITGRILVPVDDSSEFNLKLRGAEERSATVKKFQILMDEAHLSYFSGSDTYKMGIVAHPWLDRQSEFYKGDLWGPSSRLMTTRFKYIALTDQGLIWRRDLLDGGQIQWAILNGEENRSEEIGPKKETVFVWDQPWSAGWFSLGLVYGGYDQYAPFSEKSRVLIRTQARWGRSLLGFEGLYARDPADAVTDLGLADGVQLSADLPGQKATAQGVCLWWLYQLNDSRRLMLKLDGLNPAQEVADKALTGQQLALISEWSQSIDWVVFVENLQKQPKHSAASLQSQRVGFSTQVAF